MKWSPSNKIVCHICFALSVTVSSVTAQVTDMGDFVRDAQKDAVSTERDVRAVNEKKEQVIKDWLAKAQKKNGADDGESDEEEDVTTERRPEDEVPKKTAVAKVATQPQQSTKTRTAKTATTAESKSAPGTAKVENKRSDNGLSCGIEGSAIRADGSKIDGSAKISTSWNSKIAFPRGGQYELDLGRSACGSKISVYINGNDEQVVTVPNTGRVSVHFVLR